MTQYLMCHSLRILFVYPFIKFALTVNYLDLSYPINNETVFHPRHRRYERLVDFHGYTPTGIWFVIYSMTTSEHTATHLDTPYHSYESGLNLDQIPTDNLISVPAVMIDVSQRMTTMEGINHNYAITKTDLMEWESRNGIIPHRAVVLLNTGWGGRWPNEDYLGEDQFGKLSFPGLSLNGARFLSTERNAIGVGIDTTSIDPGFMKYMMAHFHLASRNIYVLENVANLHLLPPKDFKLWVMPMKLEKATTGAPIRLIAVVP